MQNDQNDKIFSIFVKRNKYLLNLFYFISFYFISFHFISFYFTSFHFILFYFISFHFISFYFILFYFILFYFILFLDHRIVSSFYLFLCFAISFNLCYFESKFFIVSNDFLSFNARKIYLAIRIFLIVHRIFSEAILNRFLLSFFSAFFIDYFRIFLLSDFLIFLFLDFFFSLLLH